MGFLDRFKSSGATENATFTVTTRATTRLDEDGDVVADGGGDPAGGQTAALEQVDHLANELVGAAGKASAAGGVNVTVSSRILVNGQPVSPDDPRAHEAMAQAAAKLRARGLDELADQLEQRMAGAPAAEPGTPPPAAASPGRVVPEPATPLTDGAAGSSSPADGAATPASADASGGGVLEDPAAEDAVTGEVTAGDVAGTDLGDAPEAPQAPSPPSSPF